MEHRSASAQNPFSDPESMDDLASMYLTAIKGVLESLKAYEDQGGGHGADILYVLAQAQTRWLTGAMRYWMQIATIMNAQGTDALAAMQPGEKGTSSEAQRLVVLDKARAALREVSELSLSEAKLLQRDLKKIEQELLDAVMPKTERDGPHRYARYKYEQ